MHSHKSPKTASLTSDILSSMGLMLLSAVNLPLWDPQVAVMTRVLLLPVHTSFNRLHLPPGQVDRSAYLWAVCHLLCAGKDQNVLERQEKASDWFYRNPISISLCSNANVCLGAYKAFEFHKSSNLRSA